MVYSLSWAKVLEGAEPYALDRAGGTPHHHPRPFLHRGGREKRADYPPNFLVKRTPIERGGSTEV